MVIGLWRAWLLMIGWLVDWLVRISNGWEVLEAMYYMHQPTELGGGVVPSLDWAASGLVMIRDWRRRGS